MRTPLSLLAVSGMMLVVAVSAAPVLAQTKSWSVGCAGQSCVAVDSNGGIAFIDLEKQTVNGVDKLTDAPKGPYTVSCGTSVCVVVDGEGKAWFGPVKPGTPYKIGKDKLPAGS